MTEWELRQRLDDLTDDLKDTGRAIVRSTAGAEISYCRICGAPTVSGEHCTRCQRENRTDNAS